MCWKIFFRYCNSSFVVLQSPVLKKCRYTLLNKAFFKERWSRINFAGLHRHYRDALVQAPLPAILAEVSQCFPQFHQSNTKMIPQLWHLLATFSLLYGRDIAGERHLVELALSCRLNSDKNFLKETHFTRFTNLDQNHYNSLPEKRHY